jgi:DNA-binding Lrp family transcriptional regulator
MGGIVDKTDVILCQLLLGNSRLSYRELADRLNLSVTAVHNRIQALIDIGIIRKFTARLSLFSQNAIHLLIFGYSRTNSIISVKQNLEKNKCIYWLAVGGGNFLYIGIHLHNIGEMDDIVRFVKNAAQIPEPTIGLTASPLPFLQKNINFDSKLYELDFKIVRSLKNDSRKATSIIADELGVSAKTVSRRLSRMQKNYLIELSIDWYPDASNDIMSIFHVQLKSDANPNAANLILQKYYPNTLFYWSLTNLPDNYIFMVWTSTSKDLKNTREYLERETAISSVTPNVIFTGYIFDSWRNQIP